MLEPRRRIDQALYAVVMEAYVHGISTRAVDDLVEAMGGTGVSKSEVSRICAGLDETAGAFRPRTLDHVEFPYIYLDATYLHVRNQPGKGGQVVSMAVVVATGVTANGEREILGLDVGDSEDEVFWRSFLLSLKQRGLAGYSWLSATSTPAWSRRSGGRSRVSRTNAAGSTPIEFARNLLAHVPKAQADYVAAAFRMIFAQPTATDVHAAWDKTRDELAARFPKLGPLMDEAKAEVLAFTAFPRGHWRKIWSTTHSSGSTRRSSAAATSWASSPTPQPSSDSSAGPDRYARRMDRRRPSLSLRGLHGQALRDQQY